MKEGLSESNSSQQNGAVQNNQPVQPKVVSTMEVEMGASVTPNTSVVRKGVMGAGGATSSLTTGLMTGEVKPNSVPMTIPSNRCSIRARVATF